MYVTYNYYSIPFVEIPNHQSTNEFTTYFNSLSDLFCCSALARAMAPVEVREL